MMSWRDRVLVGGAALGIVMSHGASTSGRAQDSWAGVLDEHPAIQYASRPTTDRVTKLKEALAQGARSLERDPRNGYLVSALDALGVPIESQLLVFSKTGVQSAYTRPENPRALFFDESVAVGYIPGAPFLELAAHDAQQGVVFYTLDQATTPPAIMRRTSCLSCHVSASTEYVPGMIVRSNTVGDAGQVMPHSDTHDVNHQTPHPDRWGGWLVTSEGPTPYSQRAHSGNITFSGRGNTSNQVFVDWISSSPDARGYPAASSDVVALLVFDHQMHAINLLTRLNWESRVAASGSRADASADGNVRHLVDELADYLLFVGEARLPVPLAARPGFAEHLEARIPKDRRGRSLAQLDLVNRLMRYPCSYIVYSAAFDGLPSPVRRAVYARMLDILSGRDSRAAYAHVTSDDRRAILEILRDTKSDFPAS
jgi:hypothetical protein